MLNISQKTSVFIVTTILMISLAACQQNTPTSTSSGVTPSTISLPSDTPIPMAVTVNGEGISKTEFDAEVSRFMAAQTELGNTIPADQANQQVLDELIDQFLLKQGAEAAGFTVDDVLLQERIDSLVTQLGNQDALTTWEQNHGYSDESFRVSLRRQIAAAWMRDYIIAQVPTIADQVHVQQILAYTQEAAQNAWDQLNAGTDFDTLAYEFDPITKGELGWFPRNYLPDIQIEEAAFALQPGEYSQVIETIAGYSILKLIEKDGEHLLSPDALLTLQTRAIQDWLDNKRASSDIVIAP
ncbi:MAG: YheU family protein [Anaerolineales bacterium]